MAVCAKMAVKDEPGHSITVKADIPFPPDQLIGRKSGFPGGQTQDTGFSTHR
jgi:hypothetical protein